MSNVHEVYVLKCLHAFDDGRDTLSVYTNKTVATDRLNECIEYGPYIDVYDGSTGKWVTRINQEDSKIKRVYLIVDDNVPPSIVEVCITNTKKEAEACVNAAEEDGNYSILLDTDTIKKITEGGN